MLNAQSESRMGRGCGLGAALLGALLAGTSSAERSPVESLQEAVYAAAEKVEPAVVAVSVSRSDDYKQFRLGPASDLPGQLGDFNRVQADRLASTNPQKKELIPRLDLADAANVPEYFGSGVVIDAQTGLVLTPYHVVRDATKVYVRVGQRGSYADILAADYRSDLAVLKLLNRLPDLKTVTLGDGGRLRKGQFVLVLSCPFVAGAREVSANVSTGVVSNLRRRLVAGGREATDKDYRRPLREFGTLIQTDAGRGAACGGGALVNLKGELVGMMTALAPFPGAEAGGFAYPIDRNLRRIVQVLAAGREVEYGFLGVTLTAAPRGGIRLVNVTPGSPAERAGLLPEDVILEAQGVPLHDTDDLFLNVGAALAGTEVELLVATQGVPPRAVGVRLAKYHYPEPLPNIVGVRPGPVRGLRVDYTSLLVQLPGGQQDKIPPGVVVREVQPGSAADRAELKPWQDVIVKVNGEAVATPEEFYQAARGGGPLTLTLLAGRTVRLP
jgi:serine protease Do